MTKKVSSNEIKKDVKPISTNTEKIDKKQTEVISVINGISKETINQKLEEIGYAINKKALCSFREKTNNTNGEIEKEYVPLGNILPLIEEQVIYKNGKDEDVAYVVNGTLLDTDVKLPKITISTEELNNVNYLYNPKWKRMAILMPIPYAQKHIRYVVDSISRDLMKCTEVYTHTGFTKINDKLIYLYHGGVIGDIENVNVDLSQDKLEQYHFTDKTFNI